MIGVIELLSLLGGQVSEWMRDRRESLVHNDAKANRRYWPDRGPRFGICYTKGARVDSIDGDPNVHFQQQYICNRQDYNELQRRPWS